MKTIKNEHKETKRTKETSSLGIVSWETDTGAWQVLEGVQASQSTELRSFLKGKQKARSKAG